MKGHIEGQQERDTFFFVPFLKIYTENVLDSVH